MSSVVKPTDRHVDGIIQYMRDYLSSREQQVVRMNPRIENVISDITWIHLEILRKVLKKGKSFGGEKFAVADVLSGGDDNKRKALFSSSDQNSIMDELVERDDAPGAKKSDQSIHDMRTLFRAIDPSLENLVQLIQHWVKWDLPDAADLHTFDEEIRRLSMLRTMQISEDIRSRYRMALGRPTGADVSDEEILQMELKRLEHIAGRFCSRRNEDEPYQLIIRREGQGEQNVAEGEPFDYKLRQCDTVYARLNEERKATNERLGGGAANGIAGEGAASGVGSTGGAPASIDQTGPNATLVAK